MYQYQTPYSRFFVWLALFCSVFMSVIAITIWAFLNNRAHEQIDLVTGYEVRMSEALIKDDTNRRLTALGRLAQRWSETSGTSQSDWEADVNRYLEDMPGFLAIEWADATLQIRWFVGIEKGQAPLRNWDLSKNEIEKKAIDAARENNQIKLSQPFVNPAGVLGIMAYAPVTRNHQFDGVMVGVLKLEQWLSTVFDGVRSDEHQTRILLEGQVVYQHGDHNIPNGDTWTRRRDFEIQGLQWTALVSPTNEFIYAVHQHVTTYILIAGLILSLLLGLVTYLALKSRAGSQEIRKAANQLETLFQNLPGIAYQSQAKEPWSVHFVSDGCTVLCGYSRRELEGHKVMWRDLIHEGDRKKVETLLKSALESKEPFEVEYRILSRDGSEQWMWERGRVVDSETGKEELLEGFISDITDRRLTELMLDEAHISQKEAEETLRQEHERLNLIIEHAHMGIVTYRFGEPFLSANRAFCQITGYTVEELMKMTVEDLTHPDDQVESSLLAAKAQAGDLEQFSHRKRYLRKDGGTVNLQVVNAITHDASGNIDLVIGQVEDLTPQLTAEAEARQHREQLAHVDRLNLLGQMATGIAHEINQPLTAISLFAQAGKRLLDTGSYDRIPEVFDKLSKHAHRGGEIIERMQTMTRQRDSSKEVTDCNILVIESAKLAEAEARIRDIEVIVEVERDLPLVTVDSVQIQQVSLNLLRNGMEAMCSIKCSKGGKILLRTRLREDGDVMIEVIDSGPGVSGKAAKKLFSPFSSTKATGMGIGLSISQTIVIAHGGHLGFKNNKSGGATFFFNLPVST